MLRDRRPDVAQAVQLVQPAVRDQDDVGPRVRGDRGEHPAGLGRQHVLHRLGPVRQPQPSLLPQKADGPLPAALGEDAALREDQEGVQRSHLGGQLRDRRGHVVAAVAPGVHGPGGQPVEDDVDERVQLQRVLEHDARPAAGPAEHLVHEQERVARSGLPAHDDQRPLGRGRVAVVPEPWAVGLDPEHEQAASRGVERAEAPAQQRAVRRDERGGAQLPAEPAAHPQAERRGQPDQLHEQVDDAETGQPQGPPAAGQLVRQQRRGQQDQRHVRDQADCGQDDDRTDDQPAQPVRRQPERPPAPPGRASR